MTTAAPPVLTRKALEPATTNFTPGERSMVAWLTLDCVDHERDVVVPSGVDFQKYYADNPVVLAVHDFGRWPLGKCAWIKLQKSSRWTGLYAKTIFDEDEEAEKVWGKIRSGSLKGISIGFRPPDDLQPGEWGPPTKDELARRPDWRGAERIIRRCVLLEYSVCSLPMNPRALVDAVNKGLHRPVYKLEAPMDTDEPEVDDDEKSTKPCDCEKADCEACQERMQAKDAADGDGDTEEEVEKAMDAAETESTEAEEEMDDENEDGLPVKTRDHVDIKAKGFRGQGVVEKIHRKGMVDHVDEDVVGTKDEPAARVQLYKAHGDGHMPTERRMGVHVKCLTKRGMPMVPPTKAKAAPATATKTIEPEPLPPLIALSESEVQQEAIRQSVEASVKRINDLFGVV